MRTRNLWRQMQWRPLYLFKKCLQEQTCIDEPVPTTLHQLHVQVLHSPRGEKIVQCDLYDSVFLHSNARRVQTDVYISYKIAEELDMEVANVVLPPPVDWFFKYLDNFDTATSALESCVEISWWSCYLVSCRHYITHVGPSSTIANLYCCAQWLLTEIFSSILPLQEMLQTRLFYL